MTRVEEDSKNQNANQDKCFHILKSFIDKRDEIFIKLVDKKLAHLQSLINVNLSNKKNSTLKQHQMKCHQEILDVLKHNIKQTNTFYNNLCKIEDNKKNNGDAISLIDDEFGYILLSIS